MDERLKEFLDEIIEEAQDQAAATYECYAATQLEGLTPIEALVAMALFHAFNNTNQTVHRQFQIKEYRVDFVIEWKSSTGEILSKVALECDGHDFHEKTKEQASRDKKRDRELQKAGYPVFRYSGRDIWKNPQDISSEVYEFMREQVVEKIWGKKG